MNGKAFKISKDEKKGKYFLTFKFKFVLHQKKSIKEAFFGLKKIKSK